MMRTVLEPCAARRRRRRRYAVERGIVIATMVPLTNTTAMPGLDGFDPDRWDGRRLRDEGELPARELVTTFGHGAAPLPGAAVLALGDRARGAPARRRPTSSSPSFDAVRPLPLQIGGIARAADPCPVTYRRR